MHELHKLNSSAGLPRATAALEPDAHCLYLGAGRNLMTKKINQPNKRILRALEIVEWAGLLVITIATVVAIGQEVRVMLEARQVLLEDILLLFIYLEILTMAGLYFKSGKLPLRYPLYIAMVAIARYIIIGMKQMDGLTMLALAGSILVLALAVMAIRFGHIRFPYRED